MLIPSALLLAVLCTALSGADLKPTLDVQGSRDALTFEPNHGQTSDVVRFLARTGNGILFFTQSGVVLSGAEKSSSFDLAGENRASEWEPLEPTGQTTSYYIGRDSSKWVEGVASYRRLIRRQVYPGIDLVYYGKGRRLEYDFQLAPHADPSVIRVHFTGAQGVTIAEDGSLVVATANGTVRHERPVVFETLADGERRPVSGDYELTGDGEAGFRVGPHDATLALSIDPVLDSATFFGGSGDDSVIATSSGAKVGNTTSIDFPGGTFGRRKGSCVFVQYGGQTLIYGGTGNMVVTSASINVNGILVAGGYTDAKDLPTATAPYQLQGWQTDYAGGATDGFVMVFYSQNSLYSFLSYVGDARRRPRHGRCRQ